MGGTCSMHGGDKLMYFITRREENTWGIDVSERIILKCILEK
jgi:hypothetical protein